MRCDLGWCDMCQREFPESLCEPRQNVLVAHPLEARQHIFFVALYALVKRDFLSVPPRDVSPAQHVRFSNFCPGLSIFFCREGFGGEADPLSFDNRLPLQIASFSDCWHFLESSFSGDNGVTITHFFKKTDLFQ